VVYFQLIDSGEDSSSERSSDEEVELAKNANDPKQKIRCKVVCIKLDSLHGKKIVGRLTVKKKHNKDHFLFIPHNPRYPNFEVAKNPFEAKQHRPLLDKKYFSAKPRPWG